jgi:hypothetical protein
MEIRITDRDGRGPAEAARERLAGILGRLRQCGRPIQDGLLWSVRNHFESVYPGSSHYDPDKVQPLDRRDGETPEGSVEIDVPGVTRAYRDLTIRPKFRRALTIPMHRDAYGKKASDFADLFPVRKKASGKSYLARKAPGGGLAFMFALVDKVFQRRDSRLMPTDESLAASVFGRIQAYLSAAK